MLIHRTKGPMGEEFILAEDVEIPDWIDHETVTDWADMWDEDRKLIIWASYIRDLCRGGCASGQYMPAVTYWQARDTMSEYGDEVFEYILEQLGELPQTDQRDWSQLCCAYLSYAVELWASGVLAQIEEAEEEEEK